MDSRLMAPLLLVDSDTQETTHHEPPSQVRGPLIASSTKSCMITYTVQATAATRRRCFISLPVYPQPPVPRTDIFSKLPAVTPGNHSQAATKSIPI
jgi:hypothetical protein